MNKLKVLDFIGEAITSRRLVNANGIPIITATKLNSDNKWWISRNVAYPKCANKPEYEKFFYRKEISFPYPHILIQELKNSRNAMRKECAQSLIDFHTKRITNITKLL